MKSVIWFGKGDVRLVDCEVPRVGPKDVLVKIEWCALCGTDLHTIEGDFPASKPPKALGHEYSGTVVEVGSDVRTLKAGDRVVGGPVVRCGVCHFCRSGRQHLCTAATPAGGGFSEFAVIAETAAYRLPDGIAMDVACLTEPVACCMHGVEVSDIRFGDTVVIIGAGGIGMILSQLAKRAGAGTVIVSEPNEFRRILVTQLGADITVDPTTSDLKSAVDDVTSGRGADVVIEATGSTSACQEALRVAGIGARITLFGCARPADEVKIRPWHMYLNEQVIRAAKSSPYAFVKALGVLGQLNLKPIITHKYRLVQFQDALAAAKSRTGVKVLVTPGDMWEPT